MKSNIIACSGDTELRVSVGKKLINYTSDETENRTDRPVKSSDQDFNSAEHLFRLG